MDGVSDRGKEKRGEFLKFSGLCYCGIAIRRAKCPVTRITVEEMSYGAEHKWFTLQEVGEGGACAGALSR